MLFACDQFLPDKHYRTRLHKNITKTQNYRTKCVCDSHYKSSTHQKFTKRFYIRL